MAYKRRGEKFNNKDDYFLAIKDFDQGILIDPKYSSLYFQRGLLYSLLVNNNLAKADFEAALCCKPEEFLTEEDYNNFIDTVKEELEACRERLSVK